MHIQVSIFTKNISITFQKQWLFTRYDVNIASCYINSKGIYCETYIITLYLISYINI